MRPCLQVCICSRLNSAALSSLRAKCERLRSETHTRAHSILFGGSRRNHAYISICMHVYHCCATMKLPSGTTWNCSATVKLACLWCYCVMLVVLLGGALDRQGPPLCLWWTRPTESKLWHRVCGNCAVSNCLTHSLAHSAGTQASFQYTWCFSLRPVACGVLIRWSRHNLEVSLSR